LIIISNITTFTHFKKESDVSLKIKYVNANADSLGNSHIKAFHAEVSGQRRFVYFLSIVGRQYLATNFLR
jgi:hypothetical protein